MKLVINKILSEHENVQVEIQADNAKNLAARLSEVTPVLDARLMELGERVMVADTWMRGLPGEVQMAVYAIHAILFGRNKTGALEQLASAKAAIEQKQKEYGDLAAVQAELAALKEKYEPSEPAEIIEHEAEGDDVLTEIEEACNA